ncbi:predicted protein [Chaetomium globosum CBS 148.51]|uniref:Uncharacterized protein n=1 Tax=Chaetomium globosum (strain ATCC 6205 / CBS 148.51 / DSM 1962 / NBRC 6347 / NRRL 1970) TaxID=306901 RepID=Q2GMB2_CHAGB|nr:uncharacterized protein CHGG_10892 [Chaetomium globosum CBS 148.51]EAQ83074.1 predicted protein [Chaetomium globosum CBS 148.51]
MTPEQHQRHSHHRPVPASPTCPVSPRSFRFWTNARQKSLLAGDNKASRNLSSSYADIYHYPHTIPHP